MNIIEAVKSGKRFRIIGTKAWFEALTPELLKSPLIFIEDGISTDFLIHYADLINDDWEIQEQKVEITKTQALKIYSLARNLSWECMKPNEIKNLEYYLKELGFE